MEIARDHRLASIAFPGISTGVYGYPVAAAARIAVNEVRAFLDGYSQKEVSLPVRGTVDELLIELEPLSNALKAA